MGKGQPELFAFWPWHSPGAIGETVALQTIGMHLETGLLADFGQCPEKVLRVAVRGHQFNRHSQCHLHVRRHLALPIGRGDVGKQL